MNKEEINYLTMEREALEMIFSLQTFRHYLQIHSHFLQTVKH
jgi:hypothetical protein